MATSDQHTAVDKHQGSAYDCSICRQQFVVPKIISCGHTFCQRCLENVDVKYDPTKSLLCPICQKTIAFPPSGTVGGFPSNFAIQQAIDKIKIGLQNTCPKHNKSQDLFCNSCKVCICGDCFLQDHNSKLWSRGHEVTSSTDKANDMAEQLKLTADQVKASHFQNVILETEQIENGNKEIAEGIIKRINEQREQLIADIRMQADELVKMVKTVNEEKNQKLGKIKKENAQKYLAKMKISKAYLSHANIIRKHGLSQATYDKASLMLLKYEEIDKHKEDGLESVNNDEAEDTKDDKNETDGKTETQTIASTDEEDTHFISSPSLPLEDFSNQMKYVENPVLRTPVKIGWIEFPQKAVDLEKDKHVKKLLPSFLINVVNKVYKVLNWK